jgi:hypothetical protein
MPTLKYSLERGGPQRLEISWIKDYQNLTVRLDGKEITPIANFYDLKIGIIFSLGEGLTLKVRVVDNIYLDVLKDGQPLPSSITSPEVRYGVTYWLIFLIAGLNILFGLIVLLIKPEFLAGINGLNSIIFGIIFLALGFLVKRQSQSALGITVGLFIFDGILSTINFVHNGKISTATIFVIVRISLLAPMIRGFIALRALKQNKQV